MYQPVEHDFPKHSKISTAVTPAKAGVQKTMGLDSGLHRNDEFKLKNHDIKTQAAPQCALPPVVEQ